MSFSIGDLGEIDFPPSRPRTTGMMDANYPDGHVVIDETEKVFPSLTFVIRLNTNPFVYGPGDAKTESGIILNNQGLWSWRLVLDEGLSTKRIMQEGSRALVATAEAPAGSMLPDHLLLALARLANVCSARVSYRLEKVDQKAIMYVYWMVVVDEEWIIEKPVSWLSAMARKLHEAIEHARQ